MATLSFGTDVLPMVCKIEARSVQSFGLYVTDANGDPADISGSTATIEDADNDAVLFTAATDAADSIWRWTLSVADTTVDWTVKRARLVITSGGSRRVWAEGQIQVHP